MKSQILSIKEFPEPDDNNLYIFKGQKFNSEKMMDHGGSGAIFKTGGYVIKFNLFYINMIKGYQSQKNTDKSLKSFQQFLENGGVLTQLKEECAKFKLEYDRLKSLSHPYIVSVSNFEDHPQAYSMSLCDHSLCSFFEFNQGINKYRLISQLCSALTFLHQNHIAHRDIKPQNILVYKGDVQLCDFDTSIIYNGNEFLKDKCGTPEYMAPEIMTDGSYTSSVDVFSFGLTVLYILTQKNLKDQKAEEVFMRSVEGPLKLFNQKKNQYKLDKQIELLIQKCIDIPQNRPTFDQITEMIQLYFNTLKFRNVVVKMSEKGKQIQQIGYVVDDVKDEESSEQQ